MKEKVFKQASRGVTIGLIGGVVTGIVMLAIVLSDRWSTQPPDPSASATAPLTGGACSGVLGALLGGIVAAIAVPVGFEIKGVLRATAFGMIVFGAIGASFLLKEAKDDPRAFKLHPRMAIALSLMSSVAGGAVGGFLVGGLSKDDAG